MLLPAALLVILASTVTVLAQKPSPCPDVFSYEPRGQEEDRWYGVISLRSAQDLTGVWIRIKLDRPAELLGNWFGEATSSDNREFTIRDSSYRLRAGTALSLRFFVKYNAASTVPSLEAVRLNGVTLCSAEAGAETTTRPQLHISQRRPSSSQRPPATGDGGGGDATQQTDEYNASVGVVTRPGSSVTPRPSFGRPTGGGGTGVRPNPNNNGGGRPSGGGRPGGGGRNSVGGSRRRNQTSEDSNDYFVGDFRSGNSNNNNDRWENGNNDLEYTTRSTNAYEDETYGNDGWDEMDDRMSSSSNRRNNNRQNDIINKNPTNSENSWFENTRRPSSAYRQPNLNSYNENTDDNSERDDNFDNQNGFNNRPSGGNRRRPSAQIALTEEEEDEENPSGSDYFPGDFNFLAPTINRPTSNSRNPINQVRVPQCGTVATRPNALISHGQGTSPGEWPWHVALYHSRGIQLTYTCGGTLISRRHVITAAHCVTRVRTTQTISPQNLLAYLGKYNLRKFGSEVQEKEVSKIYVHPEYNSTVYFNDIAVLKLSDPAQITNYVRPCCLWDESEDIEDVLERLGTVVGWGFDENRRLSNELSKAEMPVVRNDKCIFSNREFFSQFTFEKTYCAGFRNGTSVCNGDSGGGMVFPRLGTRGNHVVWQLRGVVSVGVALQGEGVCDPSHYVVFVDVAKHSDWINDVMSKDD